MSLRIPAIVALFLGASTLLIPFDSYTTLDQTKHVGQHPVGEITDGFKLTQHVSPEPGRAYAVSRGDGTCFAIQFATYMRRNAGRLMVEWKQGGNEESWQINVSRLHDNAYRNFCPTAPFSPGAPFRLQVSGVDGRPGSSATLWLVDDTRFGTIETTASVPSPKSMALQLTERRHFGVASILGVANGAFLIGWICTLLIGTAAILYALRRQPERS